MINVFKIKKWAGFIISNMITLLCFSIGLFYYGLIYGVIFGLIGLVLGSLIVNLMIKNPFSALMEGKGILVFDITSTGIVSPFIVGVNMPYIVGKFKKKPVNDVFNRDTVFNLSEPIKASSKAQFDSDGTLKFELDKDTYNKGRFGMIQYPVLLYNSALGSFITKDFISEFEKSAFAEHGILYLNRKVEELSGLMRDFGRYVVEQLKPKDAWYKSKLVWIIIIIVLVMLGALFLPAIINVIEPMFSSIGTATSSAADAQQAVIPR